MDDLSFLSKLAISSLVGIGGILLIRRVFFSDDQNTTTKKKDEDVNDENKGDMNKEQQWNDSFTFIQSADCQLGLIDRYFKKATVEECTWNREIELVNKTVDQLNAMDPPPKFLVVCGDLVDAFPFPENEEIVREKQIKDLKKSFEKLKNNIKLICVCGNHDVGNNPTHRSLEMYRNDWGKDFFSFWSGGCLFLVLNSQYYFVDGKPKHVLDDRDVTIHDEIRKQENFLNEILSQIYTKRINPKHIIVFQHIAPFLKSIDEEDEIYFSLSIQSRKKILNKLYKAGVRHIFCGHYHRNVLTSCYDGEMQIIVTSAIGAQLGDDKSGYRIVQVNEKSIDHKYVEID
ncbi:hypothetical protein SNEBB_002097 [Seison nebaliae]|nr:hypothetical protein SNEBB_002097 [Seison nebaliae]